MKCKYCGISSLLGKGDFCSRYCESMFNIYTEIMGVQLSSEEFLKQFKYIQEKSFDLVKSKNSDYGFSFIEDGYEGVLVRMTDKINRIRTISSGADMKIKTENLRDTIMDLQNYCTIAMICLDNDLHSSLLKINKE